MGEAFNKKILWITVILVVLLSLVIPDVSPTHLHTNKYVYSYGFPFKFLTLYIEYGTKFVIPNLFSGGITGWNIGMGLFGNIILFYFSLHFIFKNLTNQTKMKLLKVLIPLSFLLVFLVACTTVPSTGEPTPKDFLNNDNDDIFLLGGYVFSYAQDVEWVTELEYDIGEQVGEIKKQADNHPNSLMAQRISCPL